jgi:hypothetical protein
VSRSHESDPEDVDAAFAAIVADLRAEGVGLMDTSDVRPTEDPPAEDRGGPPAPAKEQSTESAGSWRGGGAEWDRTMFGGDPDDPDDDEHYVPPEPPPLPRPRKGAFIVLLFFLVGLLLLISPNLIGINVTLATPLGILSLAIGLALLLLRVKQGPPDGADPSNGAQL